MDQQTNVQKKILVVEDEQFLRELYVEILKNEGFAVNQAKDGEEALHAMQRGGYDLVLLDIILPKLDGLCVLQKLKTAPPQIPNKTIVALTNLEHSGTMEKSESLGIAGYIIKSDYTPNQLIDEVKKYLGIPA